jgi:hypothetical protein
MSAGVQGAPPVEVVLDTELPQMPDEAQVYQIETVDENYIVDLAHKLGFEGQPRKPVDSNKPYRFSLGLENDRLVPGAQVIEIYQDGRIWMYSSKSIEYAPNNLPSYEEAVKIAREWLVSNDLYPADIASVEKGGGLTVGSAVTGEVIPYSMIIKFMTTLDGIKVYSPSAAVTVGDNGKILEAYISMSNLTKYGTVKLKSPEAALNILKAHLSSPLANPPEAKESIINLRSFERLNVTRVTLQYAQGGGYVQPAYVFEGSAYSQRNPNMDAFRGKVDAVIREMISGQASF